MVTPGQLKRRAALFEQLAAMLAAGVPLTKAMEMAGRNRSGSVVSPRIIKELTHHLNEGYTLHRCDTTGESGQKSGVNAILQTGQCVLALGL